MDMFKMMKDAMAMKSKLSEIDKTLRDKIIEVEENGIRIKINAKSEVLDLKLSQDVAKQDVSKTEKDMLRVIQQAIKQSQDVMKEEAKSLTGGLKLPGM
ncbi:MAG: YbaB/EbfC family nucleoid-associated protein [Endomicrobiales bacterium]|nr:YbaB/EbfC family nucleoid-associated protein [Endomicrobiales bacterium]